MAGTDYQMQEKMSGFDVYCAQIWVFRYLIDSPTPKALANPSPGQRPGLADNKQSTNPD
jgi:hypothetical protein